MATCSYYDREAWMEISKKLNLEVPPVGVRYSVEMPEDVPRLEGAMPLCEMLGEAQKGNAFYAAPENHRCGAALYTLGKELPAVYTSGQYGVGLEVFSSLRSASRLYDNIPRLDEKRHINFVSLSSIERLTYNPDLLIFLTREEQSEVLLRAMSYSTGKVWTSKSTGVIGCAWLFVYPYLTGELNYCPVLSLGMRAHNVFPSGAHLIAMPSDILGDVLNSLKTMPLTLTVLGPRGGEFRKELLTRFGLDPNR